MPELLNFFSRRLLKMYFKLSKWQEKIKNSNLKTVTFSFALEKAHGISHGVIPSRIFPSTKYPL